MSTPELSPLGREVPWPDRYDPALLFPIARSVGRAGLRLVGTSLPFVGYDRWTGYELGWLDARGKPRVAIAEFEVPADSPNLIESKSLKLYLNSLAHTRIESDDAVRAIIARDLGTAAGANVSVALLPVIGALDVCEPEGDCIDGIDIAIDDYGPPNPAYLIADADHADEALVTHLFRSNCPVTGQPDWASVQIRYRGPRIDREGLLRYLVSYRGHSGFHEQCVERIFVDLAAHCAPDALSVHALYTRRGGLDINPWRATNGYPAPARMRCARQ